MHTIFLYQLLFNLLGVLQYLELERERRTDRKCDYFVTVAIGNTFADILAKDYETDGIDNCCMLFIHEQIGVQRHEHDFQRVD